jgi:hypothetical protein
VTIVYLVTLDQADADVQAAIAGELRLLEPSVRQAAEKVEALLHPDYFEFGASGRRWDRCGIVEMMTAEHAPAGEQTAVVVSELAGVRLADGIVLVTYISQDSQRRCRRSSLWRQTTAGWRVYFHQGTTIPPG